MSSRLSTKIANMSSRQPSFGKSSCQDHRYSSNKYCTTVSWKPGKRWRTKLLSKRSSRRFPSVSHRRFLISKKYSRPDVIDCAHTDMRFPGNWNPVGEGVHGARGRVQGYIRIYRLIFFLPYEITNAFGLEDVSAYSCAKFILNTIYPPLHINAYLALTCIP